MTLLVRDEADIIDAQIAFHLNAGVDFVIAMDHRSTDGTTEILESYERAGVLHLIREDDEHFRQADWVTRMARLAATEFGADWVINCDADEFWLPRCGGLKEVFDAVPDRFGLVCGVCRHFAPRPGTTDFFERMIYRVQAVSPMSDSTSPFWASRRVAHRADPRVLVGSGKHDAVGLTLRPLRTWFPIEVHHFPLRSPEQIARKYSHAYEWVGGSTRRRGPHRDAGLAWVRAGKAEDFYSSLALDDAAARAAVAAGAAAIDTRVRDALRAVRLRGGEETAHRGFRIPVPPDTISLVESKADAAFVEEVATLAEFDSLERTLPRVDALELRLARVEKRQRRRCGLHRHSTSGNHAPQPTP